MLPLWLNLVFIFVLVAFMAGGISAAPWLPTRRRERDSLLKEFVVLPGQVVYDLGCGDGVVLFQLAKREPGATYIGYELALFPWLIGVVRKLLGGRRYRNVKLLPRDLFGQSYLDADLVFVFLLDTSYPKLMKKFQNAFKPEANIVVEAWPLPGIEPIRVIKQPDRLALFVYEGRQFIGKTESV